MIKKLLFSILVLCSLTLLYCANASSYKFTATPSSIKAHAGDEISILLKVSDINAGTDGINVVETNLQYDHNIFEKVDFVQKNNWESVYNSNEGDYFGKLLYAKMVTGVTVDEDIGILKFKIKDDQSETSTQIKLLQVTSNDGYTLINDGDKFITVDIVSPDTPTPEPTPEPIPEPTPEPTPAPTANNTVVPSNVTNNTAVEQNTTNKTVVKEKNPILGVQTGDSIRIVIAILLLAVIISIAIYIYIKATNQKDPNNSNKNKENK